ncbi:MAG: tRNA (adenosine(37)-N6)-threonylcarbamoyltransferase complex ATPase subunit type 1 TsaE [Helicobacteraceae bacterium 4484_230]|nr:MAG: tRNA (adenosine(37)-N6)-threonylcarbamoyltransferase complex ATPase subunit type 1 TsaE [Helicobacteraceae bacterium 4484_230]
MKTLTLGKDELSAIYDLLLDLLPEGGTVVLQGDLASGKTTLVQAVAKRFGIEEPVTSPTFSLQQCYGDQLYHYDIYNHGIEHFLALGMLEELERPGYHFIEWGDDTLVELLGAAQMPAMVVKIEKCQNEKRRYSVEAQHA